MKSLILSTVTLMLAVNLFGQQRPQYTQYVFNNYLLNPAISGIENYTDLKTGYRNQWQGLDGAPVTSYISVHMPVGRDYVRSSANSFSESGNNPMGRSYLQEYASADPHHGLGLHAVVDKIGPLSRVDANVTYAYHLGLSARLNLSVGIAAGVSSISLDYSKINPDNSVDPGIASNMTNTLSPDLGAGIWMYGPRFFAGASVQQLLNKMLIVKENNRSYSIGRATPHFFLTTGYKVYLTDDVSFMPSVMVKYVSPSPTAMDLNMKLGLRDKFWLAGSYRKGDSFAAMAGFNVNHLFNLGYSYDFTSSQLQSVSNGTHEIVLGLLLNNKYRATCPRRVW